MNKYDDAIRILKSAYDDHHPNAIIALTSWGHDSQVSTYLARAWFHSAALPMYVNFRVYTVDTGLAADGYLDWCASQARAANYPFLIWHPKKNHGWNWYQQNALAHGFGYTRSMHSMYYRMLKERTIRRMRAYWHERTGGRVMFVSGIRRAESNERANAPEMTRNGNEVWASPLVRWSKEDTVLYRAQHDLPRNPFYETTGGSGDCQCNWGQFVSFDELKAHNPDLASKVEPLHDECIQRHGWGYGEKPTSSLLSERQGQLVLPGVEPLTTPNLCAGCQRVKPGHSEAEAQRLLQGEWIL